MKRLWWWWGCVTLVLGVASATTGTLLRDMTPRDWAGFALTLACAGYLMADITSLLGLLNWCVLQWFGVRLQRHEQVDDEPCPKCFALTTRRWYTLKRWVWPLTGWWSDYRWIARRR
jgi:hypothetical protein